MSAGHSRGENLRSALSMTPVRRIKPPRHRHHSCLEPRSKPPLLRKISLYLNEPQFWPNEATALISKEIKEMTFSGHP
jgi:hypothetical protein